jgi:hypothetical protein
MNQELQTFARSKIIEGLSQLPEGHHQTFRLMYGRRIVNGRPTRTVEDAKLVPLEEVVSEIPPEQLDWAMQQVQRSIDKLMTVATAP